MAPQVSSSRPATVLMIDDNPEELESWSKRLAEYPSHYSMLKAQTVKDGLEVCQDQNVDCVVLDLDMGDSSGFEVLLHLIPERKRPQMATVVLTHLQNPILRDTVLYHGAQAYLVKQGTSAQDLDHAIQQAIVSVARRSEAPLLTDL